VYDRFGIKVTNDESDAILIGVHAVEQLNEYQWGVDGNPVQYAFSLDKSDV